MTSIGGRRWSSSGKKSEAPRGTDPILGTEGSREGEGRRSAWGARAQWRITVHEGVSQEGWGGLARAIMADSRYGGGGET